MRVFLTGATGFIGSHIVTELLAAGHQVTGLARSDNGEQVLRAKGVDVVRGNLESPASLLPGVDQADAVIHTAFDHDFTHFAANCEKDRRVIEALGSVLKGTHRPLVMTSGVGLGDAGGGLPATEAVQNFNHPNPRIISEQTGNQLLEQGIDVRVMRLPQVHDTRKQGLLTPYIQLALRKGTVAYTGEGTNRFSACHVTDVARLYRLVLEQGEAGKRYHAVAEEGVSMNALASTIATRLGLPLTSLAPEQAEAHFGWFAMFVGMNLTASASWTQQQLGWIPEGPGLLADLQHLELTGA
ncbi:SDR family oxidoreductase [Mangrovibacter yixingensis]|uniref:SDR family oxidoreductase n=1 Tax=Mangrovibacter yixingensis TaxID=1529639 RepID=UPI001CFBF070|nr:SDR family oxidoreductase [Mangrovibacter yixingensis]